MCYTLSSLSLNVSKAECCQCPRGTSAQRLLLREEFQCDKCGKWVCSIFSNKSFLQLQLMREGTLPICDRVFMLNRGDWPPQIYCWRRTERYVEEIQTPRSPLKRQRTNWAGSQHIVTSPGSFTAVDWGNKTSKESHHGGVQGPIYHQTPLEYFPICSLESLQNNSMIPFLVLEKYEIWDKKN